MGQNGHNGRTQTTVKMGKLERYLDELIDAGIFRTRGDVAAECGTTDAVLSLVLSGNGNNRRLSVEQCLRLARKADAAPTVILRMAGRGEAAEILDDLWPRTRDLVHLTRGEQELVKLWRLLTLSNRHHILSLAAICAEVESAGSVGPVGRARAGKRASTRRRTPGKTH